jgi:hypothetical protein
MSEKPLYKAFMADDYETAEDHKSKFTEIGAAWPIKDGKGYSLKLKAWPTDGKIILLPNEPKEAA